MNLAVKENPVVDVLRTHGALLARAEELPPLSETVIRLTRLMANPDSSPEDFADVAQVDPVLTAGALRQANSVSAASRRTVGTLTDAIVRIGTSRLVALALRNELEPYVYGLGNYGMDEQAVRQRLMAAAEIAEGLARARRSLPPEFITAALLQDLGKFVLAERIDPTLFVGLAAGGMTRVEIERELLDVTHGEIGARIVHRWQLPEVVVAGIRDHDTPDATLDPLPHAVHVVDVLADVAVAPWAPEVPALATVGAIAPVAMVSLDLDEGLLARLVERARREIERWWEAPPDDADDDATDEETADPTAP